MGDFSLFDFLKLVGAAFSVLGGCFAGVSWLMTKWHKNEKELKDLQHSLNLKEIANIKAVTNDLIAKVGMHADILKQFQLAIEKTYMRYNAQADSIKTVSDHMKQTSQDLRTDLRDIHSQVVTLSNNLIMITSKKK